MKKVEIILLAGGEPRVYRHGRKYVIDPRNGPTFTGNVDGKEICVFGFQSPWPGLAEMWLVPLEDFEKYIDAPRQIRLATEYILAREGYRRLQAVVDSTIQKNVRSLEFLGFKIEQTLPDYGPDGQTYFIMRR